MSFSHFHAINFCDSFSKSQGALGATEAMWIQIYHILEVRSRKGGLKPQVT